MANINLQSWKGAWFLVTGASSGIGREFALALAEKGLNLVLVARRKDQLQVLANTLQQQYGVQVRIMAFDLTQTNQAKYLHEQINNWDIKLRGLINNAGVGAWGVFEKHPTVVHEKIVQLIALAPIALCRELLPDLREHSSSVIINISSPAAYQPVPYMASYASAKACLHHFSLALYQELKETSVLVQTLVPAPTQSEFDDKAGAYASGLGEVRCPAAEVVALSLSSLNINKPVVGNAKGLYQQRVFASLFPIKTVLATVARMFKPPAKVE